MPRDTQLAEALAYRLRLAREAKGLTQQQVAAYLGMSAVNYGDFERGRRQVSLGYLSALAQLLDHSVGWLLGLDSSLTDEEDTLLTLFRSLPVEERPRALRVLRALIE